MEAAAKEVPYYDVGIDPELLVDLQPLIDLAREHPVVAGRRGMFGGVRIPNNFFLPDQEQDMFLALSYAAVRKIYTDDDNFSAHGAYAPTLLPVFGEVLLTLDRPKHTRSRQLVSGAFLHRNVQSEWLEAHIAPVIRQRIDRFAHLKAADLVQVYTMRYPFDIITEIIGVPEVHRPQFERLAQGILFLMKDPDGALRCAKEFHTLMLQVIAEFRASPREGMIKQLIEAQVEGERLSDIEISDLLRILVPAGLDTTFRASGNLFYHLLSLGIFEDVTQSPTLMSAAIEESLRLMPVVSANPRIALRDVEVEGVLIPAGAGVIACPTTANRDARVFERPDTFDIHRPRRPILTFGGGIHSCIGNSLARAELRIALEAAGQKLPNLRPNPAEWPKVRARGFSLRTVDSLPVFWDPT